jgi:hypothetical protein
MSFVKLASLPLARASQIAASGITGRHAVDTNELEIDTSSEIRAYFLLQNLTSHTLRYFYVSGGFADGFTILPKCGVRIVVREKIYIQLESGAGEICFDRAEG